MYLSWIIPAYNEERRIARTLLEVDAYLKSKNLPGDYEIIVVNAGSSDGTAQVVKSYQVRIPQIRLLGVEGRGKGWAVRRGMIAGQGDIRLFSDADNSTAPQYFDAMELFFRQGYDIVISSRHPRDASSASRDVKEPWLREFLGSLGNLLIQFVGVWGVWDTQNGFKALSAGAAEKIFSQSRIDGFAFDIEMLALARCLGLKTAIIPVKWKFDPDSKVTLKAYFQVFSDVFKIRWNILTHRYRF